MVETLLLSMLIIAICIALLSIKLLLKKRSEEHTSELQSRQYLVCRLLLEKNAELDTDSLRAHRGSGPSRPRPRPRPVQTPHRGRPARLPTPRTAPVSCASPHV